MANHSVQCDKPLRRSNGPSTITSDTIEETRIYALIRIYSKHIEETWSDVSFELISVSSRKSMFARDK